MAGADHQEQVRCIMRQSLLLGDYPAVAAAISSLMLFPNPDSVFSSAAPHLKDAQQFVEVAWGLLELLRFHEANPDQLRRCLKQLVQLYASDSSHKEAFTVELVLQLWSQGDLPGAVEVLATRTQSQHRGGWHTSFMLQALYGMAAYQQWLDSAMPSLAPATGNNSSSASTTAAGGGRTALPPLLQQLLVLPAGRSLGDGSKSALAEKHLKGALSVSKQQPLLVLLLCQVQLAQGKPQSALRSVQSARQAMPAAADIHTLWCLMKQQPALSAVGASLPAPARAQQQMDQQRGGRSSRGLQGSQGGAGVQGDTQGPGGWWDGADNLEGSAGEPAAPVHAYRDACSAAVHVDPLNWGALEGLVQVSGHCVACCQAVVASLLLHLDVAGPAASQAAVQVAASAAAVTAQPTAGVDAAGAAPSGAGDAAEVGRLLSAAAAAVNGAPWPLAAAVLLQLGTLATEAVAQQQQQQQGAEDGQVQQQEQQQRQRQSQRQRSSGAAALSGTEVLQQWQHICGPRDSSSSSIRGRLWQETLLQTCELQLLGVAGNAARAVPPLPAAGISGSQYQQELLQEQQAAAVQQAIKHGEVVVQQLVCKAMVLAHVLGPGNAYTQQLAAELDTWLQACQQEQAARAQAAGSSSSSYRDVCSQVAARIQEALESARCALQDCVAQANLLQAHCEQQQQHVQQGPPGVKQLGEYTDAYGAYKDLPGTWWQAFPSHLRA